MSGTQPSLRIDDSIYPTFLMVHHPPDLAEARHRAVEWILATWVCTTDPNVLGLRRVDEERNGQVVPMAHIAIPLGYQRRRLAQTLGLRQVEDEQATPRVNLMGSHGLGEPHSFIRVSLESVIQRITDYLQSSMVATEINDEAISAPEDFIEEYARLLQQERREEDLRLRSALRHALAMRNAAIPLDRIQTLVNKQTREKWIRIKNVEKSVRTALGLAIKQAGIQMASPPADQDSDWAVLFPESEPKKLFFDRGSR
jgi:hypothetical protein